MAMVEGFAHSINIFNSIFLPSTGTKDTGGLRSQFFPLRVIWEEDKQVDRIAGHHGNTQVREGVGQGHERLFEEE